MRSENSQRTVRVFSDCSLNRVHQGSGPKKKLSLLGHLGDGRKHKKIEKIEIKIN